MNNQNSVFGGIIKRFVTLLLILFILLPTFPAISVDVGAAEADVADTSAQVTSGSGTWISGKLTYVYSVDSNGTSDNGAAGTVSASDGTLTVTATNSKEVSGCSTTAAEATTTSVTVTNASSYPLLINTLTPDTNASVSGVSQGDTIASGASFKITVTAPAVTESNRVTGTVEIAVEEQTKVNITLKPSPYVGYTVNSKTVTKNGSDQSFTVDAGTEVSLPAITAPSGYQFAGWRFGSVLRSNISKFTADASYTVFPVIVTEGTNVNAENFKVGSATYAFWEDAVAAAVAGGGMVVVNAEEVILPDNVLDNTLPVSGGTYVKPVSDGGVEYTLPASVKLLVPYTNSTTFHTTEPKYTGDAFAAPYSYRCLTAPTGVKLNISGAICVDSAVMCKMPLCAVPYGPHGKIVMKSGSEMTLNSGANLYCYGYINGDGEVNAKNGSTVYELMQITCWRGGTAVDSMVPNNDKVFPLSQYYVQNVEAPLNFYKGAKEYLWTCGYAGGIQTVDAPFPFIGEGGMFVLSSNGANDHITKRYHANVDRLQVAIDGNMTINKLQIEISAFGFSVDINSNDYVLPLNNMEILLKSGTTSISSTQTNGIAILPSSKITINEGATFNANAPVYFYDTEEWVGKNYVYKGDLSVCRYSTANGTTTIRTVENMKDAELDVNGTVNVSSKLYTTASGAHITSSEGTGKINFSTAAATGTTTTYQATQADTDISYHGITCNNAWLQNGDESYSQTVSTGKSTWKYDKDGEHWYRYLVDFKYNDTLIDRGYYCENNDTVTYDASWLTNLGASVTSGSATAATDGTNVNVTDVTAYSTVTLTGTPKEYIPTFVLSEEEYRHYQLYNEGTLEETTIDGKTGKYYIVKKASSAMAVGTSYDKPTDESMGVNDENHNTITWNMSGVSATSGDPYRGIVPAGETAGEPVYIYGFYTGVIAHNSWNDQYYPTLIEAFEVLPQDVSATITLLADCGTFEEESDTQTYTSYIANDIILDLNGHDAPGKIVNKGKFTLSLGGGTFTGTVTNESNGTMNLDLQDGLLDGDLTNSGTLRGNYNGGTLEGKVTNGASATAILNLNGGTQTGAITNSGTLNYTLTNGTHSSGTITNNAGGNATVDLDGGALNAAIVNKGEFTYNVNGGTHTMTSTTVPVTNSANMDIDLGGGTIQYATGLTAASSSYRTKAAVVNGGEMTITDTVGGGKITADAVEDSSTVKNYVSVVRNYGEDAVLTMSGNLTLENTQGVNNYSAALMNYTGTANVSDQVTITAKRGTGIFNVGTGTDLTLKDSTVSVTAANGSYAVYNYSNATISEIDNCDISTVNTNVLYNATNATITAVKNSDITVTTPTTANVYAVYNTGSEITLIDGCHITANSGIHNLNMRGDSYTAATGATISHPGIIGTIKDTTVNVGQYAVYNRATINTMIGSTFTAAPASAQVKWPSGTAALNKNVACYTVYNDKTWWGDSAVWKRTDTSVDNDGTTMLKHRVIEYKTEDEFLPTIGTITDCTIEAQNTSTSAAHGHALENLGVINEIGGTTVIKAEKHANNASTKLSGSQYAINNTSGGKIGTIGSDVTVSAQTYAIENRGARISIAEADYSTTYLKSGTLSSGSLATDYDYTYANPSEIGSSAATVTATSTNAYLNYGKIGSITGSASAIYNVIVNAGAATTTTSIDEVTANTRVIEHRRFENDDASLAENEIGRDFEYTRNTEDGCYIGTIDATVTATGAGYQAVYNQGYIGTLAGTVSTPTGKATSSSTYYPLIYNGNQRQATLKQTEDYYIESNGAGATRHDREYTYAIPTIDTVSCTATNPQDYTLQNFGQINNLTGTLSAKTITVANEASGPFLTRKTRQFYSSSSAKFAGDKASTEVTLEYTRQPAEIKHITGADISTTNGTYALRNYGHIEDITSSTITSTSTNTIANTSSTVTEYTSNRADVLIGCVPSGSSSCALVYDTTKTIDEDEIREVGTIDTIGAGNYFQGTYNVIANTGRINNIDSGDGDKSIIYASSRQAIYNYNGYYSRRTNTDAELTDTTGTLTNHYTYEYTPAYIGTIKNVAVIAKRQAILNGASSSPDTNYNPVTIGEIGEGAEIRTTATATYHACHNIATVAKIEKITGGVFMTGEGTGIYGLYNASTTYPIQITGGDFRGGDGTRALAIYQADKTTRYTYPGAPLSAEGDTESATYHTLKSKVLTPTTGDFYYITDTNTVTFDKKGHGDDIDAQYVQKGSKATQPTAPAVGDIITEGTAKFRFDGWFTDDTFETAFNFDTAINEDTTVYAKWTPVYTVTWKNGNDIIETDYVASGETPTYDGETPTKPADAQYTYTFDGWSTNPGPVLMDTTYTAKFKQTVNEYTITWVDGNGDTLKTEKVAYGETPSYTGETPTKAAADGYTYTFNNTWSPAITSVTGDQTYTAQFDATKKLTVTWQNYDGTVLETDKDLAPDTAPAYNGSTPEKPGNAQYTYTFAGWSTDGTTVIDPLPNVTENVTYKAVFTETVNTYTVTWKNSDGTVLETDENVPYDTTPSYDGATPTKEGDAQYSYTFGGWTPEIAPVTGDATYTAQFTQTTNTYTVTWVIDESASEAEVKTAVDAMIAKYAQQIYDAAKEEQQEMHDGMGVTVPMPTVLNILLGGNYNIDSAYVQYKILAICDNDSTEAANAETRWATEKDTLPTKLANSKNLLTADEKAQMAALSGGKTILETDNNVPYGTNPSYDGATPTKENDDQYSYTFDHWTPEIAPVTGDVTYTAVFAQQALEPKHSITLGGEVGVNFYIPTATVEADDVANSTVKMNWGPASGSDHGEAEFALKDLTNDNEDNKNVVFHEDNDGGLNTNNPIAKAKINGDYYQFTAYVAAKQMKDQITVQIVNGSKVIVRDPYCVADYCNEVIADKDQEVSAKLGFDSDEFAKLQTLCKAMLTYGSRAQTQFSYNTENLADEGIDYTYTPAQASDFVDYYKAEYMSGTNDMAYYGSSLLLEAETTYSVWMRYENAGYTPPTATAKIGDEEIAIETMKVEGNYDAYYVRYNVINLPANLLTKDITVDFNGDQKTYNAKSYFYLALSQGNDTLKNTITSLYNYNLVAVDYFG